MVSEVGKLLILIGCVVAAIGLLLTFVPGSRLGRLPGDMTIQFRNLTIHLPLATSLLLSILLTLGLWLLNWLRK